MRTLPVRRRHVLYGAALGGGVGGLAGLWTALLRVEAVLTRRAIPVLSGAPLADGAYPADGSDSGRPPLRLAMLGDSSAVGVGCELPEETPGALLATALAAKGRQVLLEVLAVSGSRSADLEPQVTRALLTPPHLAVICIGANDVTARVSAEKAAAQLAAAVQNLVDAGSRVVVATCPDLGVIPPLLPPLRQLARVKSRQMAEAQAEAVERAGGTTVPVARLLAAAFASDVEMFCGDRFHPSPAGYARLVEALLPAVCEAAGVPLPGPIAAA